MSMELADRLYRQGNYPDAMQAALALVDGPEAGTALILAAKCFVALGALQGLDAVLQAVRERFKVGPERTFFAIENACLNDGLYQPLIQLEQFFPEGALLYPIALYHGSCARMMLGDEAGAAAGFDRFRLAMPRFLDRLPLAEPGELNLMFRQGTQVLPPEATAERIAQGHAMPPAQTDFAFHRPAAAGEASPVLLCCADARYVETFLPRWLPPILPLAPLRRLHVHVVEPTPEALALVDALAAQHGLADRMGVSTSRDRYRTSTSYACARFEVMPDLLAAFGAPAVAIDIDSGALPPLAELASALPDADFACFETGRCEPASVHAAGVLVFRPDAASAGFARDLAAYCRPKLNQPANVNWMLDQAALYSAIRLRRRDRPEFRYVALDRSTGRKMTEHIANLASDAEKYAIRAASAATGARTAAGATDAWTP